MKLLLPMTYYRPYVSGPIIYAENLAQEMLRRGHEVTFLTSRHEPALPGEEMYGGVRVIRVPVAARLSKGVLMPRFPGMAWRCIQSHDAVLIQAPQFEAPLLAALALLAGKPSVLTYHCDVQLPPGLWNRVVTAGMVALHLAASLLVSRVVAYTEDYALHSPVMKRFPGKVTVIPPPVGIPPASEEQVNDFMRQHGLHRGSVIGIAARAATEKGFEHLLDAIPLLADRFPDLKVLHAGEAGRVIGEESYHRFLRDKIERQKRYWVSLGVLDRAEMAVFLSACDVTVLPSLNRTESFGLVQVESMLCGTPVVASDLPGVRVPVRTTGMGRIVPPGDTEALARAISEVLSAPDSFRAPREIVEAEYSFRRTAEGYEELLNRLAVPRK
jgi:glycosyltransferase involved in cell wall biosynthesis